MTPLAATHDTLPEVDDGPEASIGLGYQAHGRHAQRGMFGKVRVILLDELHCPPRDYFNGSRERVGWSRHTEDRGSSRFRSRVAKCGPVASSQCSCRKYTVEYRVDAVSVT